MTNNPVFIVHSSAVVISGTTTWSKYRYTRCSSLLYKVVNRCLYSLLDEPFAGVDPISVNDVRNLVLELKGRSIGVLITDHNVRDTLKIVDRAYILHDGRVIVSGLPEDVVNNDNVRRVYLGNDFNIL